jgi:preprotein translocase subunit SecA
MGQLDPLVAWQREGFQMFGQMMDAIDDDYLRYVMHVQVIAGTGAEPDFTMASYAAAEDPSDGPSLLDAFRATAPDAEAAMAAGAGVPVGVGAGGQFANGAQSTPQHLEHMEEVLQPVVKSPNQKLGRNEPCFCGSGKKFKLCHGAV